MKSKSFRARVAELITERPENWGSGGNVSEFGTLQDAVPATLGLWGYTYCLNGKYLLYTVALVTELGTRDAVDRAFRCFLYSRVGFDHSHYRADY
jgi:hypothetical protein